MKKLVLNVLALLLVGVMLYSGWRAWNAYGDYRAEAEMHGAVMEYKPQNDEIINQSVIDLQAKYPDVAGWLTIPGTKIDYPFVWYEDNDYYLRRDLNGDYALAGTLFLDFRCEKDFTSPNTIIYGHHMKNGSMFGTLKSFADKAFFDANTQGTIYLPRETLTLEFFAYMVVKATDQEIYSVEPSENWLGYVRQNARQFRDIGLADADQIITLSTCSYEFDNARMVLLAKIQ
ncbi:MAG: class B sortase [Oscillospiraceae bacterium]|nr:class B sortase [Oscillospiraceae bacterium]